MKAKILLVIIVSGLSIFVFCGNDIYSDRQPKQLTSEVTDTVINVSEHFAILYKRYDSDFNLWYDPYIIRFDKKDTVKIAEFSYENGSELNLRISPNKRYVVLDNIIKGYVEDGAEKTLYENYLCDMVDLEQSMVIIGSMKEHCVAEWDKDNRWIYGDEIIFDGSLNIANCNEPKLFVHETDWSGVECEKYFEDDGYTTIQKFIFPKANMKQVYNIIKQIDRNLKDTLPQNDIEYTPINNESVKVRYKYKTTDSLLIEIEYQGGVTSIEISQKYESTTSKITYSAD